MTRGVRVLAQQRAIAEVKRRLQRKGVKLQLVPYREIVALAEEIVLATYSIAADRGLSCSRSSLNVGHSLRGLYANSRSR